jgi:hypothetical protein
LLLWASVSLSQGVSQTLFLCTTFSLNFEWKILMLGIKIMNFEFELLIYLPKSTQPPPDIPILQMRKVDFRMVKQLVLHVTEKWRHNSKSKIIEKNVYLWDRH